MKVKPNLQILLFSIVFFNCSMLFAQHTFSIVAVDTATGEIGSAGATCIAAEDGALAISDIVLGVGAIHTQSFWSPTNQANARIRMEAGDSPQEIIDWLQANDVNGDPSARQYNIVDLNGGSPRSAAFTGANCFAEFIHITGPNYAIAGNILISEDVVNDMETGFLNTTGTLADKLMGALQGAKRPGADSRCLSDGVSSASAFIRVADPTDTDSSYGNLSLDLNVWITTDVFEPIDALQDAYDATLGVDQFTDVAISIYPNPAQNSININSGKTMIREYELITISGQQVLKTVLPNISNRIYLDIHQPAGIYFLRLTDSFGNDHTEKIVVQ